MNPLLELLNDACVSRHNAYDRWESEDSYLAYCEWVGNKTADAAYINHMGRGTPEDWAQEERDRQWDFYYGAEDYAPAYTLLRVLEDEDRAAPAERDWLADAYATHLEEGYAA